MIYEKLLRPFFFRLDPEEAHELAIAGLERFHPLLWRQPHNDDPRLAFEFKGLHFPNRIGLAAGMDKAAQALLGWQKLGFGHLEMGTVTWSGQEGNPKPRLFRLPEQKSLLNRLGFNNPGAPFIRERLQEQARKGKLKIPLGINIGKSRCIDPNDEAEVIEDYLLSLRALVDYAAYITVNVSSPNTPGLRDWLEPARLTKLLTALRQNCLKPILLKLSPDLADEQILEIARTALTCSLDGLIATNTTVSREHTPAWAQLEKGGVSGELLAAESERILALLAPFKSEGMLLVSVGGISTGEDVRRRLALGADLVQVYTAFVYAGPSWVNGVNAALLREQAFA